MNGITRTTNEQALGLENPDLVATTLERTLKAAMDISSDMDRVVTMTPQDGYKAKINLINNAQDMSTKEKLEAIDAAENKYVQDLSDNAEVCKGMMWHKTGVVLVCFAGIVLMGTSPEGRKIAKSVLKLVA